MNKKTVDVPIQATSTQEENKRLYEKRTKKYRSSCLGYFNKMKKNARKTDEKTVGIPIKVTPTEKKNCGSDKKTVRIPIQATPK